ncbi:hypothetical protein [Pyrococcus kukulkanii]|uniref:Uncharacterized protein n=1 Tax=Pyrococcus kukulkanii TaxID=1609559 RepID=A0ABV4T635_9EURY
MDVDKIEGWSPLLEKIKYLFSIKRVSHRYPLCIPVTAGGRVFVLTTHDPGESVREKFQHIVILDTLKDLVREYGEDIVLHLYPLDSMKLTQYGGETLGGLTAHIARRSNFVFVEFREGISFEKAQQLLEKFEVCPNALIRMNNGRVVVVYKFKRPSPVDVNVIESLAIALNVLLSDLLGWSLTKYYPRDMINVRLSDVKDVVIVDDKLHISLEYLTERVKILASKLSLEEILRNSSSDVHVASVDALDRALQEGGFSREDFFKNAELFGAWLRYELRDSMEFEEVWLSIKNFLKNALLNTTFDIKEVGRKVWEGFDNFEEYAVQLAQWGKVFRLWKLYLTLELYMGDEEEVEEEEEAVEFLEEVGGNEEVSEDVIMQIQKDPVVAEAIKEVKRFAPFLPPCIKNLLAKDYWTFPEFKLLLAFATSDASNEAFQGAVIGHAYQLARKVYEVRAGKISTSDLSPIIYSYMKGKTGTFEGLKRKLRNRAYFEKEAVFPFSCTAVRVVNRGLCDVENCPYSDRFKHEPVSEDIERILSRIRKVTMDDKYVTIEFVKGGRISDRDVKIPYVVKIPVSQIVKVERVEDDESEEVIYRPLPNPAPILRYYYLLYGESIVVRSTNSVDYAEELIGRILELARKTSKSNIVEDVAVEALAQYFEIYNVSPEKSPFAPFVRVRGNIEILIPTRAFLEHVKEVVGEMGESVKPNDVIRFLRDIKVLKKKLTSYRVNGRSMRFYIMDVDRASKLFEAHDLGHFWTNVLKSINEQLEEEREDSIEVILGEEDEGEDIRATRVREDIYAD